MKKTAFLIICVCISLFLFGCSNNSKNPSDTSNKEDSSAVTTNKQNETTKQNEETTAKKEPSAETIAMRKKNAEFNTSDFGSTQIVKNLKSYPTGKPTITPESGKHPRVMFTSETVGNVLAAMKDTNNRAVYSQYKKYYYTNLNSALISGGGTKNLNYENAMHIDAMALRYVETGDELYAQRAIYALKNTIIGINESGWPDPYRGYGIVAYVAACVYDWCYDCLTDLDKTQIINGVINNCLNKLEIGLTLTKQGDISHHNLECQILRGYLAFGIAVYDEYPALYNLAMTRLTKQMVPAQNYLLASGTHWEGSNYGLARTCYLLYGQKLISAMTNGKEELFNSEDLLKTCQTFIDYLYPGKTAKGTYFELGDQASMDIEDFYLCGYMAGSLFGDSNLLGLGKGLVASTGVTTVHKNSWETWFSPALYFVFYNNDVNATDRDEGRKLLNLIESPRSTIFAKTSKSDDAVAVYMTMPEMYTSSHSHMEAGSFQIYCGGTLASDSGVYDGYGTSHHYSYSMQTISSNSILVYNTSFPSTISNRAYSGGQSIKIDTRLGCPSTLAGLLASKNKQATITGKAASADTQNFNWAYLGGDMTNAYDSATVDEVSRHMIAVKADGAKMVFVTYDRITADNAGYKKTVLLHSHYEPKVNNGFITIDNGKAQLVAQTCLTDMKYTVYGVTNSAYIINGTDYAAQTSGKHGKDYRVDMSPKKSSKTDNILTVMYVTDSGVTNKVTATEIKADKLVGASIFNVAILFAKDNNTFGGNASFTVGSNTNVYICGVKAGSWKVTTSSGTTTINVADGDGILTFTASGSVSISMS